MSPRIRRSTAGVLALSALALSGCGGADDDVPEVIAHVDVSEQGTVAERLSGGARPDDQFGPMLQWARPDMLVLTTFGSSSCPVLVEDLSVREDGIQQVVLTDPAATHGPCTADLAPRELQVPVLDEALDAGELTVWIRSAGEHYGQVTEFSMGDPPTG
ncbi:hypothetical protein AB0K08_04135 [Citricoccus sp. NPDC055426]|uniref:hypothetical protein n=1 Tax=Citricoccus sp. NPDC055426 TaxID=3155536 RepID=UPI00343E4FCC